MILGIDYIVHNAAMLDSPHPILTFAPSALFDFPFHQFNFDFRGCVDSESERDVYLLRLSASTSIQFAVAGADSKRDRKSELGFGVLRQLVLDFCVVGESGVFLFSFESVAECGDVGDGHRVWTCVDGCETP